MDLWVVNARLRFRIGDFGAIHRSDAPVCRAFWPLRRCDRRRAQSSANVRWSNRSDEKEG